MCESLDRAEQVEGVWCYLDMAKSAVGIVVIHKAYNWCLSVAPGSDLTMLLKDLLSRVLA